MASNYAHTVTDADLIDILTALLAAQRAITVLTLRIRPVDDSEIARQAADRDVNATKEQIEVMSERIGRLLSRMESR